MPSHAEEEQILQEVRGEECGGDRGGGGERKEEEEGGGFTH